MNRGTVAILSPHFPPATLAGVHRARHLARHLPAFGWQPVIIRADESTYTEPLDPTLAALVPSNLRQIRTGALPSGLMRQVGIGDIGLRAYQPLAAALTRLAQAERIDAVLITGSPFYPMLMARMVQTRLALPVILDFQDPWISAEGALRPRWSKGGLAHRLALALEPRAVRHASFVTSVSDRQNSEMAQRYPWLDRSRMAAIPIGGDPADFEMLRANPPVNLQVRLDPDRINLSYVGTFLPRAGALVRALFAGLRLLCEREPALANRIRLNFVGTSNQPSGAGAHLVTPLAAQEGVATLVQETPQRVPYLEALSLLAQSNGLLMIGSDEPHYTASKIYPNLMAKRPFLSLFHDASSAHAILSAAGGGSAFSFSTLQDLPGLTPAIADTLRAMALQPERFGASDPAVYEPYTARNLAGQFAAVLDKACA
ncbi:glycosyl transferase family 4 [Bosea sp. 124]|nr:glycosyl transferase family 4 [Bosea sp. 124]